MISSILENPEWNNTTVLRGDVVEEVTKLKEKYEGDIAVHGSAQLAQTLIEQTRARPSACASPRRRPSATASTS